MINHSVHPCPDLRGFQRDLLVVLARDDAQYGLELKSDLETRWDTKISRSRLYSNVNDLIERGLIEKAELTGRANHYAITDRGEQLINAYSTWITESLDQTNG
ncbi:helix-turn-helix transcriptional regulator [Halocatena marina]|uniref:Helix-turn-helix transcriptional regulator n=1 Tax=Halocatena marina TaxID=2934937 RepID=A0ABD5YNR0_9EURY|nr:helix-turn-helix transcriptional regulator [Halocatena marina]